MKQNYFKGMQQDRLPHKYLQGEYQFALNAVNSDQFGSIVNEEGNIRMTDVSDRIIGIIPSTDFIIIISLDEIGLYSNGVYTQVQDNNSIIANIGFSENYPVTGEYYFNYRGEIILALVADNVKPMVLNIGTPEEPRLIDADSSNDILMFPQSSLIREYFLRENNEGGSLLAGSYAFVYQYEDNDGTVTSWNNISEFVRITDDTNTNFEEFDGAPPVTQTSKSIDVRISNADSRFEFINIAVLRVMDSVITVRRINRRFEASSGINFTYTGNEASEEINLSEILIRNAAYDRIGTLANYNGRLYAGNLTARDTFDARLQQIANQCIVNYNTSLVDVTSSSGKSDQQTGFAHGEVYAMYIQFFDTDGNPTMAYHIPGRDFLAGDRDTVSPYGVNEPRYKVEDTTNKNIQTYAINPSGVIRPNERNVSNMGFWENQNEPYPNTSTVEEGVASNRVFTLTGNNGFLLATHPADVTLEFRTGETFNFNYLGNREVLTVSFVNGETVLVIQGTESEFNPAGNNTVTLTTNRTATRAYPTGNVRHHRFPSFTQVRNTHFSGDDRIGRTHLDRLGFEVSNVNIPVDLQNNIQGWRIFYATRDFNNSLVQGMSIIHNMFDQSGAGTIPNRVLSTGGNWRTDYDGDESAPAGRDGTIHVDNHYKFLSPETLIDTPNIGDSYFRYEWNLTKIPYSDASWSRGGGSYGDFNRTVLLDYTDFDLNHIPNIPNPFPRTTIAYGGDYGRIQDFQYPPLQTNTLSIGNRQIDNIVGEPYLHLLSNHTVPFNDAVLGTGAATFYNGTPIQSYVGTIYSTIDDCYNGFQAQQLVSTGVLHSETTTFSQVLYSGDTYLCDWSYKTFGRNQYDAIDSLEYRVRGLRCIHRYVVESRRNVNLRFEDQGEGIRGRYYPKSEVLEFYPTGNDVPFDINQNDFGHNIDFERLNDFESPGIYDPENEFQTRFPNGVIASRITGDQRVTTWKSWAANDFNNLDKTTWRGPIENLQAYNNDLLIHCNASLFTTRSRTRLESDQETVDLGSGQLFDLPIDELIPEDSSGYAGTQNQLACVMSKYGYIFIDSLKGKVYIYNGTLKEISTKGMRKFFRDNFPLQYTIVQDVTRNYTPTKRGDRYTLPIYESRKEREGQVYYDLIPPDGWEIDPCDENYFVIGNDPGDQVVEVKRRFQRIHEADNPFQGVGYTIGLDEKYNRIIISRLNRGRAISREETNTSNREITRQQSMGREVTRTVFINRAIRNLPSISQNLEIVTFSNPATPNITVGPAVDGSEGMNIQEVTVPAAGGILWADFFTGGAPDKLEIIDPVNITSNTNPVVAYSSMENQLQGSNYYPNPDVHTGMPRRITQYPARRTSTGVNNDDIFNNQNQPPFRVEMRPYLSNQAASTRQFTLNGNNGAILLTNTGIGTTGNAQDALFWRNFYRKGMHIWCNYLGWRYLIQEPVVNLNDGGSLILVVNGSESEVILNGDNTVFISINGSGVYNSSDPARYNHVHNGTNIFDGQTYLGNWHPHYIGTSRLTPGASGTTPYWNAANNFPSIPERTQEFRAETGLNFPFNDFSANVLGTTTVTPQQRIWYRFPTRSNNYTVWIKVTGINAAFNTGDPNPTPALSIITATGWAYQSYIQTNPLPPPTRYYLRVVGTDEYIQVNNGVPNLNVRANTLNPLALDDSFYTFNTFNHPLTIYSCDNGLTWSDVDCQIQQSWDGTQYVSGNAATYETIDQSGAQLNNPPDADSYTVINTRTEWQFLDSLPEWRTTQHTQWFNGTGYQDDFIEFTQWFNTDTNQWQNTPFTATVTETETIIGYESTNNIIGPIKGNLRSNDTNFMNTLQPGDLVLFEGQYKQIAWQ